MQEFLKLKNNKLILCTIFLALLSIYLTCYTFYLKTNDVVNCEDKVNTVCNCKDKDCNNTALGEHMISSKLGYIYINEGNVYYKPNKTASMGNSSEAIDMSVYAKKIFGDVSKLTIKSSKFIGGEFNFDYKLDLTDVLFANEVYFGNGGTNFTVLFVHSNGTVSELSYTPANGLKLYKKVNDYSNIVAAVVDQSQSGNGVNLYDKCGNVIKYSSPQF